MPSGQPVALGGGVDRPVLPPPERQFAGHQQHHLDEPAVGGAALDLRHRQFGVLLRHHDRGAQPGVAVQPLARDPVVHRARHGGAEVLAERRLHAVEAVADGDPGAERVQRLGAQPLHGGRGLAVRVPPVGPHGERAVGRVGDGVQLIDAAPHHRLAPHLVEIRHQRRHRRHRRDADRSRSAPGRAWGSSACNSRLRYTVGKGGGTGPSRNRRLAHGATARDA